MEKEPKGSTRWLEHDEAVRLLDACRASRNTALADLVEFAMFTGVRQAEALGLTWDRVDRARGVILLDETKNDEARHVPLCQEADGVLARRYIARRSQYVFGSRKWDTFRTAWENARAGLIRSGVKPFRFHDLRHTCASWLVQQGRPLNEVREILGHKDIKLTLRYAHLAPKHLRAAAASLDGILETAKSISRSQGGHMAASEAVPVAAGVGDLAGK